MACWLGMTGATGADFSSSSSMVSWVALFFGFIVEIQKHAHELIGGDDGGHTHM